MKNRDIRVLGLLLAGVFLTACGTPLPSPPPSLTPTPAGPCRIAYEQDGDIYVRDCDGSGILQLTSHRRRDAWPSWSPDGQRVVFCSNREGQFGTLGHAPSALYVVNADGSNLTRLTSEVEDIDLFPAWSPDGSRIAFNRNCDLAVINPDGSDLWTWESDEVCVSYPAWSPDGTRLAFASWQPASSPAEPYRDVYVINGDGTNLLQLAHFDANGEVVSVWSPDGGQIGVEVQQRRIQQTLTKCYLLATDGSGEPEEIPSIPDSWYPWYWPQWDGEE